MTTLEILKILADEDFHLYVVGEKIELIKLSTRETVWKTKCFNYITQQENVDLFIENWCDVTVSLINESGVKKRKGSELYRDLRSIFMRRVTIT